VQAVVDWVIFANMTKWKRPALLLLSPVYWLGTTVRNTLYNSGILKSTSFDLPIISVGNLSAGGTGKTPHVEYLLRLLSEKGHLAVLSRGYGRRTKGFLLTSNPPDPFAVGDESAQIKTHFPKVEVAVCENRVKGVDQLLRFPKSPDIIVLDDAFQHRRITPGLHVVLTTFAEPFFNDGILPAGNLREGRREASRADVIVVSKCPADMQPEQKAAYRKAIGQYTPAAVFFSYMQHGQVRWMHAKKTFDLREKFLLVTGIANPINFIKFLKSNDLAFEHMRFPDHHLFTKLDVKRMRERIKEQKLAGIVTTEKDATRFLFRGNLQDEFPIAIFPIEVQMEDNEQFDQLIFDFVSNFQNSVSNG
jgi:tetraacyldisaccharide 4'-kinase